ncbi:MAG: EAL domain-containing protein, partial [Gemmatimonadaceae bacterium]|nr:EAL domain-containing protein [Gemmatimonadaceae bacterium]
MTTLVRPTSAPPASGPSSPPARILVVDDDLTARTVVTHLLGRDGHDVVQAADGKAAVRAFAEAPPDLVLLDVVMPGIDGFETCAQLRALDPLEDVPIVMLTGADDYEAIDHAFRVRATDFMSKPLNPRLLLQRVRYALRAGRLNREVRQSRARQATALRIARLAFWEWHLVDDTVTWSDPRLPLEGLDVPVPTSVRAFLPLVHDADRDRIGRLIQAVRENGDPLSTEMRLVWDGQERLVRVVGGLGAQGRDRHIVSGAMQDITAQRHSEELATYLALHDDLTGLGNRRHFMGRLRELLADARAAEQVLLVAWLDVTRFQRHNDALGERQGDRLLRQLGRRLQRAEAPAVAVARVGGDEFAVGLLAPSMGTARFQLDAILQSLELPYEIESQIAELSLSCGVACYPDAASDEGVLTALAEDAQRRARAEGLRVGVPSPIATTSRAASDALAIERALRAGLRDRTFELAVQPQYDLGQRRVVGVECLLRWTDPSGRHVPPYEFVPVLEETGLIVDVGVWVLEEACRWQRAWAAAGHDLRVAVNVSSRQMLDPVIVDRFAGVLAASGVPRGRLELELTESLAMQRPEFTVAVLQAMREQGALVAIDDFGTGHSSLSYLLQ